MTDHAQELGLGNSEGLLTPFLANNWSYDSKVVYTKEDSCVLEHGIGTCRDYYPETLRVATYNIWNLNNLDMETYHDRLERIGKVGTT